MTPRTEAMIRKRNGGKLYDPRSFAQRTDLSSPFSISHRTGDPDVIHTGDPSSCPCRTPQPSPEVPF